MDVKVNLTPEQINTTIAEAIAKSAIGEKLNEVIKREVENLSRSFNNPFDKIVADKIHAALRDIINEKYSEQIKKMVSEKLTIEFTSDLFGKLWDSFVSKY